MIRIHRIQRKTSSTNAMEPLNIAKKKKITNLPCMVDFRLLMIRKWESQGSISIAGERRNKSQWTLKSSSMNSV
jgi:hypothetical protein